MIVPNKQALIKPVDRHCEKRSDEAIPGIPAIATSFLAMTIVQSFRNARAALGFTLIELAVALFLVSLLLGTIFVPLQSQIEARKIEQTGQLLERAREALLGYAAANGYFPCPADATSSGRESAGTNHSTGYCPAYQGFLPAATLGFPASDGQGYAVDGWGIAANRIRYAIADATVGPPTNTHAFTRANGMRTAGIANLSHATLSLFHVCDSGRGVAGGAHCGTALTLVSTTPIVVWSAGANAATGGASVHEAQNPNPNGGSADRIFVMRTRSSVAGNEFDDIVTWIPMPILIGRMLVAGHVP